MAWGLTTYIRNIYGVDVPVTYEASPFNLLYRIRIVNPKAGSYVVPIPAFSNESTPLATLDNIGGGTGDYILNCGGPGGFYEHRITFGDIVSGSMTINIIADSTGGLDGSASNISVFLDRSNT